MNSVSNLMLIGVALGLPTLLRWSVQDSGAMVPIGTLFLSLFLFYATFLVLAWALQQRSIGRDVIFAVFNNNNVAQLAALTMDGKVLWKKSTGTMHKREDEGLASAEDWRQV